MAGGAYSIRLFFNNTYHDEKSSGGSIDVKELALDAAFTKGRHGKAALERMRRPTIETLRHQRVTDYC
ncbi:MAG: hypothetical protein LBP19_05760 [Treponema sp.]|nr:hypothetical protein [Treponema sp.]